MESASLSECLGQSQPEIRARLPACQLIWVTNYPANLLPLLPSPRADAFLLPNPRSPSSLPLFTCRKSCLWKEGFTAVLSFVFLSSLRVLLFSLLSFLLAWFHRSIPKGNLIGKGLRLLTFGQSSLWRNFFNRLRRSLPIDSHHQQPLLSLRQLLNLPYQFTFLAERLEWAETLKIAFVPALPI